MISLHVSLKARGPRLLKSHRELQGRALGGGGGGDSSGTAETVMTRHSRPSRAQGSPSALGARRGPGVSRWRTLPDHILPKVIRRASPHKGIRGAPDELCHLCVASDKVLREGIAPLRREHEGI